MSKNKLKIAFYWAASCGKVYNSILNMAEMAFRAYDPCFGCATHYAVGQMPMTVKVYDSQKQLLSTLQR